ncbi:suppressor protein SRP40 [Asparagus officinalis]|uniref:suppressor protein SRP40 n=1 Tax=Asparagus officinalis TaxID=4686 RepID=UPI00098DE578|nr:suppressor protein SRP40 [Asparagus officinalis]
MLRAPKPPATSALIPFVPRQVMLDSKSSTSIDSKLKNKEMEKENKKKKKESRGRASETLENGSGAPETLEVDGDGGRRKDRKLLLSSIAGFLESSGFLRTLSAFRSEAEIESDGSAAASINLEDLFFKFLETSTLHVEIKDKKKKKKEPPASVEENANKSHLEISPEIAKECDTHDKAKKRKKHKMSSEDHNENTEAKDHKEKFQEDVEEKIAELKSLPNMINLPAETNGEHKSEKKKKKKTNSVTDSLSVNEIKQTTETSKESESVKEKDSISENNGNIEKKVHKKRKRLDSEERALHDENSKKSETPQKLDKSSLESEDTNACKKRKKKKGSESSDEAGITSNQEQDPSCQHEEKELGTRQLPSGESKKNEEEKGTATKSKKKEKHSAEPKTVNAFQRVKVDEVKFADERLQDNSYWALDDTGSGYGAKAQEVLGQVRGRDFRHEKTKKKRGTYRGGQIDLQSHSIKFNYSDEE